VKVLALVVLWTEVSWLLNVPLLVVVRPGHRARRRNSPPRPYYPRNHTKLSKIRTHPSGRSLTDSKPIGPSK
jgi:hypothetical protein